MQLSKQNRAVLNAYVCALNYNAANSYSNVDHFNNGKMCNNLCCFVSRQILVSHRSSLHEGCIGKIGEKDLHRM
jgi:hypothetical protein